MVQFERNWRFKDEPLAGNIIQRMIFNSPDDLISRFYDYIDWLDANKLKECKLFGSEGEIAKLDKMRMPTMQGFQFYLRTVKSHLDNYRSKGKEWEDAFYYIEDAMYALSIEGAAAGLLKDAIVIRKLQLADKTEQEITNVRRVVILHTPDNGRGQVIEEAEEVKLLE